eukprot:g13758.t1
MFLFGFGFPVWGEVLCGVAIGSDRTMRLEVLRVLAESQSIYNLFGRAAAILIDATLRGPESSLRELLAPLVLRLPCVRALPKTKTDEWVMLPHTSPLPPAARCASTLAGRVEAGSGIFYVPATQADSQLVDTIAKAVRADKDVALVRNLGRVALKYTQVDVMFSPSHLGVSVNEIADAVTTHLHTVTTPAETTVPPLMSHEEAKAAVGDIMEKSELDAICDLVEKKSQSSQKIAQDLKLTRKKVHDLYRLAKGEGRWFRRTFANLIGAIRFKEPTCAGLQKRPRLSCGAPEDK